MIIDANEMLFFAGRAAILVVAFVTLAIIFVRWRRAGARDTQSLRKDIELLRDETRVLVDLVGRVANGITVLDERMETSAQLASASAGNVPHGYDVALRLARNGAAVEEIAETSGVTRNEAQLLARLHGPDTSRMRTGT